MSTEPYLSEPITVAPRIACGHWHDDKWMSGYLRGRFEATQGRWRLVIRVYVPATEPAPIRVLIRHGPVRVLDQIEAVVDEVTQKTVEVEVGETGQVDILLQTDRCCARSERDLRELGVVLVGFDLVSTA